MSLPPLPGLGLTIALQLLMSHGNCQENRETQLFNDFDQKKFKRNLKIEKKIILSEGFFCL
jgi:hypothetical protein